MKLVLNYQVLIIPILHVMLYDTIVYVIYILISILNILYIKNIDNHPDSNPNNH